MGKSPGKWIKTVLFGKKHSKSNSSKNATLHRKASAKASVEDLENPIISNPVQLTDKGAETLELEKGTSGTPGGTIAVDQGLESQSNFVPVPVSDDEMRRQHQAATKVQAVFRGYLARRAFRALKGIIRLQALIRGHLVRRQAVATLRCMQAIVKFQALARGRRVRLSNTKPEVGKKHSMEVHHKIDTGAYSSSGLEKLATNAYVRKLLPFLPTAMPLSLQYDQAEPNSAWSWLQRWSVSRFWEPPVRTKKVCNTKPQRKQGGSQLNENESGKSRRTTRKVSNGDNGAVETDKLKRNPRKVTSQQMELVQEQPQSELERVKRSLKKVSTSVTVAPQKPEMETEKPQQQLSSKTVLNSAVPEKETAVSAAGSDIVVDKISLPEAPLKTEVTVDKLSLPEAPLKTEVTVDVPNDDPCLLEMHSSENGEKMEKNSVLNDEKSPKGDEVGKENHKIRKRRSLSSKQEYSENISLNTPSIPSYMAATQSAKAKLRIHGSPKFSEDGAEVGYVRRHSLPASTNGKLSSLSPRIQKPVQANGKGSNKTNRPITTSSRDDKVLQPGWRR